MKIELLIDNFLEYCKIEKNYSPHTLLAYSVALRQLMDYLLEIEVDDINAISSRMLKPFLGWMSDKGLDRNSIRQKIAAMKSLFKYAYKQNILSKNLAASLVIPKAEKKLPSFLLQNEATEMMDTLDNNTFQGTRNLALLELIYSSGLRIGEALQLKIQDIDNNSRQIKVLGKGNKERIVPVGEVAMKAIKHYLQFRSTIPSISDRLFLSSRGNPFSAVAAWRMVNSHLQNITQAKQKSPHILRHSFATHLLNNGAELPAVSMMLGHSNLSSTQIYTHLSVEHLKKIYKQSHPKGGG